MPKTLADLLKVQIKKAGHNPDDDKYKGVFTDALAAIEVPDDLAKALDSQLISIVEAKNNHQDIKNHYAASILDGVDKEIDALAQEFELSDDDKNILKLEKSSYKKISALAKQLQKKIEAKASAGAGDKKALQEEINKLNSDLKAEKENQKKLETQYQDKEKGIEMRYAINNLLTPHKTIHDGLDYATKQTILNTILAQDMQTKGLKFDFDESKNLVLYKLDGATYHEDNMPVNANQYIEKVLANKKQLAVNQPPIPPIKKDEPPLGGNGQPKGSSAIFKDLVNQAMEGSLKKDPAIPTA